MTEQPTEQPTLKQVLLDALIAEYGEDPPTWTEMRSLDRVVRAIEAHYAQTGSVTINVTGEEDRKLAVRIGHDRQYPFSVRGCTVEIDGMKVFDGVDRSVLLPKTPLLPQQQAPAVPPRWAGLVGKTYRAVESDTYIRLGDEVEPNGRRCAYQRYESDGVTMIGDGNLHKTVGLGFVQDRIDSGEWVEA